MIGEASKMAVKIKTTVVKYGDEVPLEDIQAGKATPIEVIVREEDVEVTPEQLKQLQVLQAQIAQEE